MASPVIIATGGEAADALERLQSQLAERYARHYRIESVRTPDEAAALLDRLAGDGADVALVLAGPGALEGADGELFDRARRQHPQAKRALLVSPASGPTRRRRRPSAGRWGSGASTTSCWSRARRPTRCSTRASPASCSSGRASGGWCRIPCTSSARNGRAGLRAAGGVREPCRPAPVLAADSEQGRELRARAGPDARLPLMVLPDGRALSDPSNAEIALAAGAPEILEDRTFDLLIVGSGPAGLSAAVYGASEGPSVIVVDSAGRRARARSSATTSALRGG